MIIIWPVTEEDKKQAEKMKVDLLHPTDAEIQRIQLGNRLPAIPRAERAKVLFHDNERDVMRGIQVVVSASYLTSSFPYVKPENSLTIADKRGSVKTDTYVTIFSADGKPIFTTEERENSDLRVVVATRRHAQVYRIDDRADFLYPDNRKRYAGSFLWIANPTLEREQVTDIFKIEKGTRQVRTITLPDLEHVISTARPYNPAK